MPIYKGRRPGTYRVVVWSKGRRHDYTVEGSKVDARAHEARMRVELDARSVSSRRAMPNFFDFSIEEYKPYAKTHLKRTTWANSRKYQLQNLIRHFGHLKLNEFSELEIEGFKRTRIADVGATTVNNELRLLGTVLRWAQASYPITVPKLRRLKPRGHGRVKAWTAPELDRLFQAARAVAPELLRALVFLVNTGCRKGEAIAAEWDWIDFGSDLIRIPSNEVWQPKNDKPREVPISDACRAVLIGNRSSERWVFPNRRAERYANFPKDLFWRAREAAGLTGGVHKLRHTFASHFLLTVPDLFLLAQILGHSHSRVTELYSHLLPGHLDRAKNAVNLAPKLQTVAATVSGGGTTQVLPAKTGKRH